MTWLTRVGDGETAFERAFSLRRDLFEHYRELYARLWEERLVDLVILELCRLRVAQLHRADGEVAIRYEPALEAGLTEEKVSALPGWPTSPLFSPAERACLAFAEKFVIDVHSITDADASAVTEHLGPEAMVAFTLALGLLDGFGRFRLSLGLDTPLDGVTTVPAPASRAGTLY